jgi:sulfate/thiosulfate transport system substrate-binding protein
MRKDRMQTKLVAVAAGLTLLATALVATAVGSAAPKRGTGTNLNLVAYSTPRDAYSSLIPLFQKTPDGDGVSFTQSYGASGDQTRAIIAGLKADVVELSLAPDMDQLASAGIVSPKWKQQSYKGIVTNSVVVFVVRPGNPKHIKTWNDLIRRGVQVVTPNPFTSGGARWNIMAAYGAWRKAGLSDKEAQARLLKLFRNVVVQDKSARDSVNTFLSGKGDVLLSYENEALGGQKKGQNLPFIIPRNTILIENPIAVTKTSDNADKANQFLRFLRTPAAQQVFADWGYRPVVPSVLAKNRKKFPVRPGMFTIDQLGLGGWDAVQKRFFDPDTGVLAKIERQVGGATG